MPSLREELNKLRAFEDPTIEAALNIERTAARFRAQAQRLLRPHGLSPAGYNVLRILRGHSPSGRAPKPLTCTQIRTDMITAVPDLTRLVDRLVADGLVARCPSPADARAVHVAITDQGRKLLAALDEPVRELHRTQLGHLSERELAQLSKLLVKARHSPQPRANDEDTED
jgi:DNA-binding MarR family transcriptional regulator